MPQLYTASRIFEVYCEASSLDPMKHQTILTKLRYMAKRRILLNGIVVDDRGTYAFPVIEVFRAAIYIELAGLTMDIRAFEPIVAAAGRGHPDGLNIPASMKKDGGWSSHGGLWDAIHGVSLAESWALVVELTLPKSDRESALIAEFVCNDVEQQRFDLSMTDAVLSRKPVRTRMTIDLTQLFSPLIKIVGVPEL